MNIHKGTENTASVQIFMQNGAYTVNICKLQASYADGYRNGYNGAVLKTDVTKVLWVRILLHPPERTRVTFGPLVFLWKVAGTVTGLIANQRPPKGEDGATPSLSASQHTCKPEQTHPYSGKFAGRR